MRRGARPQCGRRRRTEILLATRHSRRVRSVSLARDGKDRVPGSAPESDRLDPRGAETAPRAAVALVRPPYTPVRRTCRLLATPRSEAPGTVAHTCRKLYRSSFSSRWLSGPDLDHHDPAFPLDGLPPTFHLTRRRAVIAQITESFLANHETIDGHLCPVGKAIRFSA